MRVKGNLFWGIFLIVVGILFLGNNLDFWNVNLFFDGWWTLFIIVPSIRGLFEKNSGSSSWSFITLILGILLLLAAQDIINWNMIWKILLPVIIIIVGLSLLWGNNRRGRKINSKNAKEYVAVFSGVDEKVKEIVSDFRAVAVFGGIELDLRRAKLDKDIVIDAVTVLEALI